MAQVPPCWLLVRLLCLEFHRRAIRIGALQDRLYIMSKSLTWVGESGFPYGLPVPVSHHYFFKSVVIISTLPFSLTRSRGEYLRVVGILELFE